MAKHPDDRFSSMEELADELEACLGELAPDLEADATMVVPAATALPRLQPARVSPRRGRGRRVVLPLVLAGLAAAVTGAALALVHYGVLDFGGNSPGTGGGGTPPPGSLQPVPLQAAGVFDPPPGDGHENDDAVGNATDGDATTYWSTEGYNDGLAAIGKKGVGLVLAAPQETRIARVTLRTDTPGFVAELQAGSAQGGPFETVSGSRTAGRSTTFQLRSGTKARFVVIWITELAHPGDRFRAHVNEVTAKG